MEVEMEDPWSSLTLSISSQLVQQMGSGRWPITGWRMTETGQWEGTHMMTCQVLSPVFVCHPPPRDPPPHPPSPPFLPPLCQIPTGRSEQQRLVMKGLSNGSFLYPSPTKLVWQLFPLCRPALYCLCLPVNTFWVNEFHYRAFCVHVYTSMCVCAFVGQD